MEILIDINTLLSYFESLVIPELQVGPQNDINSLPIVKATCIKFVYMFRNQIPPSHVTTFVDLFANYLKAESRVVQSYAAACIDKLLTHKDESGKTILNASNVDANLVTKLLQHICELLNENKDLYAIRALLRVIQLSQQNLASFAPTLGNVLATFITEVAREQATEATPNYIYILFEASALVLFYVSNNKEAFK